MAVDFVLRDIKMFMDIFKGTELEDWFMATLEHVNNYNLHYEVFHVAAQGLDEKASPRHCAHLIGIQLDEWDL